MRGKQKNRDLNRQKKKNNATMNARVRQVTGYSGSLLVAVGCFQEVW
jgi:hypothetical protein